MLSSFAQTSYYTCSTINSHFPPIVYKYTYRDIRLIIIIVITIFTGESSVQSDIDGRIRSFPHVRGNWACYVYLPLLLNEMSSRLHSFRVFLQDYFRLVLKG